MRRPRLPAGVMGAVLALTLSVGPGTAPAAAGPVRLGTVDPICADPIDSPVRDGEPLHIDLPPYYHFEVGHIDPRLWADPPSPDPAWSMWFYAMRWAQRVAVRAEATGQTASMRKVVDQVAAFYVDNPDPGTSVRGWDEGTSLRRLETLNCLYRLSSDERIPGMMRHEVAVQFGPRYYGPPLHNIHNHGLMANQFIIAAGSLTHNAEWVLRAAERMSAEIDGAFSDRGVNFEQSAAYHLDNFGQWNAYAAMIEDVLPGSPIPARIRAKLAAVREASLWLTEPDGMATSVGDSLRVPGVVDATGAARRRPGTFRDDRTGWLVGRFSWTDPMTTFLVVRYGPKTWAHGQFDKGSVVWSTAGSRVLVGPGYSTFDPVNPRSPWWKKPYAHNVAIPRGRPLDPRAGGTLVATSSTSSALSAVVADRAFGLDHRRGVVADDTARRLIVGDSWPRGVASSQHFHLDHTWKLVGHTPSGLVARNVVTGRTMRMTTTGRVARVSVGSPRYQDGWQYLRFTDRRSNVAIVVDSRARRTTTTFLVE